MSSRSSLDSDAWRDLVWIVMPAIYPHGVGARTDVRWRIGTNPQPDIRPVAGLRLGRDQIVVERVLHKIRARSQPELLLDVRAVGLDGAHREEQLLGDVGVGVAQRDHSKDP